MPNDEQTLDALKARTDATRDIYREQELLDQFAGQAMQAIITLLYGSNQSIEADVDFAWRYAEAMITKRRASLRRSA